MVSKDQAIGGLICMVCVVVAVLYTLGLFYWGYWMKPGMWNVAFTLVAIPVFVAFIAIMGIGAWIGWTMATTPPPKPIEEITTEMETEKTTVEEKPAEEEKSSEPPETEEEKSSEPPETEEEKPEKKRKT